MRSANFGCLGAEKHERQDYQTARARDMLLVQARAPHANSVHMHETAKGIRRI